MTEHSSKPTVLVGIDGSDGAAKALRWAVNEAAERGWSLNALYAFHLPAVAYGGTVLVLPSTEDLEKDGQLLLESALESLPDGRGIVPTLTVRQGPPARVLHELSEDDSVVLTVVGSRGHGGLVGLLLGSVSQSLVHRPAKPLVVVPGQDGGDPDGPIVVGVDGSPESRSALVWALDEAKARGCRVRAVCAAPDPGAVEPIVDATTPATSAQVESAYRGMLDDAVDEVADRTADVERVVAIGPAAPVLAGEASSARMLVVGSRGLGAAREVLAGSTGHALSHKSPVPLVIVPTPHG